MGRGVSLLLVACFGFFIIMLALGISLPGMNMVNWGLDFSSMDPEQLSLWQLGFWIIGFGILMWGITNEN